MTSRRKKVGASRRASKPRTAPPQTRAKSVRAVAGNARAAAGKRSSTAVVVAPAADCTIAHAGSLHAQLSRVIAKPAHVVLDLAAIRRIDTAGIQVLATFIRDRRAAGRGMECRAATEAFMATAGLLGLDTLFRAGLDA